MEYNDNLPQKKMYVIQRGMYDNLVYHIFTPCCKNLQTTNAGGIQKCVDNFTS